LGTLGRKTRRKWTNRRKAEKRKGPEIIGFLLVDLVLLGPDLQSEFNY
jgi:hypothetical protein